MNKKDCENDCYFYICKELFSYDHKHTLERIDNDIGHKLHNCKLDCATCNNLINRNDPKITALLIQHTKYYKLIHLQTTVTDENEYYSLRNSMAGGKSHILRRYNIIGETYVIFYQIRN